MNIIRLSILTLVFALSSYSLLGRTISFKGSLTGFEGTSPGEIFLLTGSQLIALDFDENGVFECQANYGDLPSFFTLAKISRKGKLTYLTSIIWFESDSLNFHINLKDGSHDVPILEYQSLSEALEKSRGKKLLKLVKQNPNDLPSLYFLERSKEDASTEYLTEFINNLDSVNQQNIYALRIKAYLEAKKLTMPKKGQTVANIELTNVDGKPQEVNMKNGKTKVIALMSSSCYYSISSLSLLASMSERQNAQLELITIWDDKEYDVWQYHMEEQKDKISWTDLWDQYNFTSTYFNQKITPTFLVISGEGVLLDRFSGFSEGTATKLGSLLQQE